MTATEISSIEIAALKTTPVVIQGIVQKSLVTLTSECDALVNGIALRLPAGTTVSLAGGGSGGTLGRLACDLGFVGRDGRTYRATHGMEVQFAPAGWAGR